jgi:hypothetical protein
MTVKQLIRYLSDFNEDSEVRLAMQPSWPFEYSIGTVECSFDEDENGEEMLETVYLAEGRQLGYLPGEVTDKIGWGR